MGLASFTWNIQTQMVLSLEKATISKGQIKEAEKDVFESSFSFSIIDITSYKREYCF